MLSDYRTTSFFQSASVANPKRSLKAEVKIDKYPKKKKYIKTQQETKRIKKKNNIRTK